MKLLVAILLVGLAAMATAKSVAYHGKSVAYPYGYGHLGYAPFPYHGGYHAGFPNYHGGFPYFGGVHVYYGAYPGQCGNDGLYYNDANSFVICSNGNAYHQNCAPGSQNSGRQNFVYGSHLGYTDFCDVNLNSVAH